MFGESPSAGLLAWGPDGLLYFSFRGPTPAESGIGRVAADGTHWDLVCAGVSGESGIQFDRHGRLFLSGASGVLQVPFETDFREREWADQAGPILNLLPAADGEPRAALVFEGDRLTPAERDGLLEIDAGEQAMRQYELANSGPVPRAHPGRILIQFTARLSPTQARVGPDGGLWLRVEDDGRGRIVHVHRAGVPPRPVNLELWRPGN